ncbi:MAG: cation transporter, partial [Thaumarchaeota archaeon]|nr:cation transporter [Nitrososphaerota archaeon]
CCCTPTHGSWRRMRIGAGIRIEYLSSAWMIVEAFASIGFGLIAGSLALLAFGGDSLIELISGVVVLLHLRKDVSGSGVNSKRTEQITSALLFALIPVIGLGAVYSYTSGLRPEGSPLGTAVAIGAVVIMPYLYFRKKQIGEETRSLPLKMDAIESITCLLMAIVLLGGLLAEFFLGLWWADYLATGVILAFVAKEAVESYRELREEE